MSLTLKSSSRKVAAIAIALAVFISTHAVTAQVAMRGQLNFQLRTVGDSLNVSRLPVAEAYSNFERQLSSNLSNGPVALASIREFESVASQLAEPITNRIQAIVNPAGRFEDLFEVLDANPWASALFQYAEGDNSDDEQPYVRVNTDLRTGNTDAEENIAWVTSMRQAMSHLPKFEGISFRGTRLSEERIARYYPLNGQAVDLAFISSSTLPTVAFRFAKLWEHMAGDPEEQTKIAVIFVIKGKTGRPVSSFARMHSHEQEILFANGTPFTVTAKSPIFNDAELGGRTQLIMLTER